MRTRYVSSIVACLLAVSAYGRQLPNIDKLGERAAPPAKIEALARKAEKLKEKGLRMHGEPRHGVPTFVWGSESLSKGPGKGPKGSKATPAEASAAAKGHLKNVASYFDLNQADIDGATLVNAHDTGKGPIIAKMQQKIDGVEIFREELNVVMDRNFGLVSLTGYISSKSINGSKHPFKRSATEAAAEAIRDLTETSINSNNLTPAFSRDGYDFYNASGVALERPVRVKKVFFHLEDRLEPSYYVEVNSRTESDAFETVIGSTTSDYYSYVISASDGSILFRNNLTVNEKAHAPAANLGGPGTQYTYRVWADAVTGIPSDTPSGNAGHPKVDPVPDGFEQPFVAPTDVTLSNFPFSMNDPWLPPGANETVGNNADAYVDLVGNQTSAFDGYNPVATAPYGGVPACSTPTPVGSPSCGDFRAQLTAPGVFGSGYNTAQVSSGVAQRLAATQQLFYDVNFLHDWFYDSGFNEAAGNAQNDNFGRGGLDGDSMRAEAQDVTGVNNANMATPADGDRPRMQMFVFTANTARVLTVNTPAAIAGDKAVGVNSTWGPQSYLTTGDVVQATDALEVGTGFTTTDGCSAFTNAPSMVGKIAMTDRGGCGFTVKAKNAQNAGAIGVIVANIPATPAQTFVNMGGTDATVTIPGLLTQVADTTAIKNQLTNNVTVNVTMRRDPGTDRDGTLDNQIVAHEWGHYLSNRLISNANGLSANQARGMGEGWGDFVATLLTVRADDVNTPSNANWNGVYALATYATGGSGGNFSAGGNGAYFGIRRIPYSTDMTKDPLTFKHTMNGEPLNFPGVPFNGPTAGTNNSQFHNTGEIWSTMLWECYASLLRDTQGANPRMTFAQAQERMKQYLVASLKMTPANPTFVESRDAVLAAALATDSTDYVLFQQAFAKRGLGVDAVSADRFSTTHSGTVESFATGAGVRYVSSSLNDSVLSCDGDGVLDNGERGLLTITLKNLGTTPLTATTATITSATAGVSFPNGNTINFPTAPVLGTTTSSIVVALAAGVSGIQIIDFDISYTDAQLAASFSASNSFVGNTKSEPNSSNTDSVETADTTWTVVSTPSPVSPWARFEVSALSHLWRGVNAGSISDERLESTTFTADSGGSVTLQFAHSWSFENGAWDGGVVEKSVDGGANWTDAATGSSVTNGYNGTILTNPNNPLSARAAFINASAAPTTTTFVVPVPAGNTVRFRFRIGTDEAVGAPGWSIDDISLTGIAEVPFSTLIADPGCATATTSTTLSSSLNPSTVGANVTLTAAVVSGAGTVNTGTVTFKDGATTIGTSAVTGGVATLNTSVLALGSHPLTAAFSGSAGIASSNSNTVNQVVNKAAATVALTSAPNPSNIGQSVTFTATVSTLSGTPTGSVTFKDGATTLGSSVLSGGVATFTTSALAAGPHSMTAEYGGNATTATATGSLSHTVATGAVFNFAPAAYSRLEDAGPVTLTVTRTGGDTSFAASVNLSTVSGTALAGVRFNGITNQAVNFAAGETSTTVDVTLIDTLAIEGQQSFTATLSSPLFAALGANSVATVTVMDDDGAKSDFSAPSDGANDIVWRNGTTGDTRAWTMTGTTMTATFALPGFGTGWKLSGVADFNADGHADLLWRNNTTFAMKVNYMTSGNLISSTADIETLSGAQWQVGAVGDMNRDGFPDIIWRNTTTFASDVWLMRDNIKLSVVALPAVPDGAWQIIGLGDFTADGKTDMVWRHGPTLKLAIWIMNDTTFTTATFLPSVGAPWLPVGVGDLDGDGDADLLWQTTTTRQLAKWEMNGTTFVTASFISTAGDTATANDPNFQVVAPR